MHAHVIRSAPIGEATAPLNALARHDPALIPMWAARARIEREGLTGSVGSEEKLGTGMVARSRESQRPGARQQEEPARRFRAREVSRPGSALGFGHLSARRRAARRVVVHKHGPAA